MAEPAKKTLENEEPDDDEDDERGEVLQRRKHVVQPFAGAGHRLGAAGSHGAGPASLLDRLTAGKETATSRADSKLADDKLADALSGLIRVVDGSIITGHNNSALIEACLETLLVVCRNAAANNADPKFLSLKLSTTTFKMKISNVRGGEEFLYACGFRKSVTALEPALVVAQDTFTKAILNTAVDLLERRLQLVKEKSERAARSAEAARVDEAARKHAAVAALKEDMLARREAFKRPPG